MTYILCIDTCDNRLRMITAYSVSRSTYVYLTHWFIMFGYNNLLYSCIYNNLSSFLNKEYISAINNEIIMLCR